VIALKNAADARMNTSSVIRLSHSILSRSVIEVFSYQYSVVSGRRKERSGSGSGMRTRSLGSKSQDGHLIREYDDPGLVVPN